MNEVSTEGSVHSIGNLDRVMHKTLAVLVFMISNKGQLYRKKEECGFFGIVLS